MSQRTFGADFRQRKKSKKGPNGGNTRRVSAELKVKDLTTALASDTTGAIILLNGLPRGTGISERLGRQVLAVRLVGNVVAEVTPGTGVDQVMRFLVVYDKQPNQTALTILEVLTSVSVQALKNISNQKRFQILHDSVHVMNATAEPGSKKQWKLDVPLSRVIQFDEGTAGTIADITTGSLYAISIGSIAAGVTAGTQTFESRYVFSDA